MAGLNKLVNKHPKKRRRYQLLVGCGEHDLPMEIEIVNEWAEYENCDKIIIKGAGHCANAIAGNYDKLRRMPDCGYKLFKAGEKPSSRCD